MVPILRLGNKFQSCQGMKHQLILILVLLVNCQVFAQPKAMKHIIKRVNSPVQVDANWEKSVWKDIPTISLSHYMGEKPDHFPKVQAKMAYDDEFIYLIWKVDDQYVQAVADENQGPVFRDSCVEFFFTPDNLQGTEYFNLEMNCGGTMLFHHQDHKDRKATRIPVSEKDIGKMKVAHSLPRMIPDEIEEKTIWYLEYAIPFEILKQYYDLEAPESGSKWRANFYKCADGTSHPHWLTWSPVDFPSPNFHLPQFFGNLEFE